MKRIHVIAFCLFFTVSAQSQNAVRPQVIVVRSGSLKLRALLWKPSGRGPFRAVLFCPGSGQSPPPHSLGRLFAKHGYVFLALYRRGQGLSSHQGEESGSLVIRERSARGDEAANRLQLQLLEGEQLDEQINALAVLRSLRNVDSTRIALVGHSFGGSLAMLLAERDPTIRAVINFAGGAGSWNRSPALSERLISAAQKSTTPVFFIHAANDYSTLPGEVLDAELARRGSVHRLEIFPAVGKTPSEGHNIIYLSIRSWERDVFAFLDQHTASK